MPCCNLTFCVEIITFVQKKEGREVVHPGLGINLNLGPPE